MAAANSASALRSLVEKADDRLNGAAISTPKEMRVLAATHASRAVLDKLDSFWSSSDPTAAVDHQELPHRRLGRLLIEIDTATTRLSEALASPGYMAGTATMLLDTASVDTPVLAADDNAAWTGPGLDNRPTSSDFRGASLRTSNRWAMPFASPDPMSSDIETASSLILSDEPLLSPEYNANRLSDTPVKPAPLIQIVDGPSAGGASPVSRGILGHRHPTSWPLPEGISSTSIAADFPSRRLGPHSMAGADAPPRSRSTQLPPQDYHKVLSHARDSGLVSSPSMLRGAARESRPRRGSGHQDAELSFVWQRSPVVPHHRSSRPSPAPSLEWRAQCTVPRRSGSRSPPVGLGIANIGGGPSLTPSPPHSTQQQRRHDSVAESATRKSAPRRDSDLEVDVDHERARSIIKCWNDASWDEARVHVEEALKPMSISNDRAANRRLRHLQGVLASLKGDWNSALQSFLFVLRTPIEALSALDAGDCAAALWLGDTYSLLGRKPEALLCYSIAVQGPLFCGKEYARLHQRIRAETAACWVGTTGRDIQSQIHLAPRARTSEVMYSFLDARIITEQAAHSLIGARDGGAAETAPGLDPNHSRAIALCDLGLTLDAWGEMHRMPLNDSALAPTSPWPVCFDPFFAMANVADATAPAVPPCDLVQMLDSSSPPRRAPKIAKAAALGHKGMNSFTCPDLRWLVIALRECLSTLEMRWSEFADDQNTWLQARYDSVDDGGIATQHFFTITLFRLTFRSGYGAEVCSRGIASARIRRSEPGFDRGVHQEQVRRVKKRIRDHLEAARARHESISLQGTVMPVMSINAVTGMHRRLSTSSARPSRMGSSSSSAASPRAGSFGLL